MHYSSRILGSVAIVAAPFLLMAAKPSPTPSPFVPALAYKYGPEEIRLSNAEGTQAVLLVRKPRGDGILWLALAPLSQRRVAYIESSNNATVRSLRIVSWAPQATGGLAVTIDPQPMLVTDNTGLLLADLDFSPDGSQVAALLSDYDSHSELRLFDVATRQQIGGAITLSQQATSLSWRTMDNAILLGAPTGFSLYKDGLQQVLFDGPSPGSDFDAFNGAAADVVLPYKDYPVQGNSIQRWDGASVSGEKAVLSTLVPNGIWPNMSCDNSRMIYTEMGAKRTAYNLVLATGAKVFFSKDSNVQRMTYPNSCS